MPARHRLRSKRSARAHEIFKSNSRQQKRRTSLRSFNLLVDALGLPLPKVDVRHVDGVVLKKILRTLARRCTEGPEAQQFESSVRTWVSSGGGRCESVSGVRGRCDVGMGRAAGIGVELSARLRRNSKSEVFYFPVLGY